jgi:hypothetical protein
MSRLSLPDHEALSRELQGLARLSRHSLVERWTALYGTAPLPRTSRSLLIRAVAYRMQERALGGLKPAIRRALAGEAPELVEGAGYNFGLLLRWLATLLRALILALAPQRQTTTHRLN